MVKMQKYFDIYLEFSHTKIENIIDDAIKLRTKGYVCAVDGNVLAQSTKNMFYKDIINGSIVNTCDGSSIAMIAGFIHKQKFSTYTGPDIFAKYVKENYKQYFLGNTEENLERLKTMFLDLGYNITQFKFEPLPFRNVEDFDYAKIATNIYEFSPDIIWVSLGAPKQEIFISNLYPHLEKGILFAIGAAFNLFLGDKENKRAPEIMRSMHLEWFYRAIQEPRRVGRRAMSYLILLPILIIKELKQIKQNQV